MIITMAVIWLSDYDYDELMIWYLKIWEMVGMTKKREDLEVY